MYFNYNIIIRILLTTLRFKNPRCWIILALSQNIVNCYSIIHCYRRNRVFVRLQLQTRHILIESTKNTRYILTGEIYEGNFLFALLPFLCMTWFLKSWLLMILQVISWLLREGTITHITRHFQFSCHEQIIDQTFYVCLFLK